MIAIDGPIAYAALQRKLREPVEVTIKAGRMVDIEGGEKAVGLKKLIDNNENATAPLGAQFTSTAFC